MIMKTDIHPKYFENIEIRCSCGNVIIAGSTKEKLRTELCSKCHPFYTGQQKLIDTAGRVDKFVAQRKRAEHIKEATVKRTAEKKKKPEAYVEKVVPLEVLARAEQVSAAQKKGKGKWGAPLGDTPASEIVKEKRAETKKVKTVTAKKVNKKKEVAVKKTAKKTPKK